MDLRMEAISSLDMSRRPASGEPSGLMQTGGCGVVECYGQSLRGTDTDQVRQERMAVGLGRASERALSRNSERVRDGV